MGNLTFLLLPLLGCALSPTSGEPGCRPTGMADFFPNIKKSNVETAGQEEDCKMPSCFACLTGSCQGASRLVKVSTAFAERWMMLGRLGQGERARACHHA